MNDPTLIRGLGLMIPLIAAAAVWSVLRPTPRVAAGALLATLWNLAALVAVNLAAVRLGWWGFAAEGGVLLGLPIDLLIGWSLLWGTLPAVAMRRWPAWVVVAALVWADVLVMPLGEPVVTLGERWLWGEAVAVGAALVPGLLLARWTAKRRRLLARTTMQVVLFAVLIYGLLPAAILEQTGEAWQTLWARPRWLLAFAAQAMLLPAAVGLTAVIRFAREGEGTPLPYDPPVRMVTSGPYAYLANPMQAATCVMLLVWGCILGSAAVAWAGPMTAAFAWGVAEWHERRQLAQRFGPAWWAYHAAVRIWLPRWRPYVAAGAVDRLYVATSCGACREVARWFERRGVRGVAVLPAEEHPTLSLRRVRYETADGEAGFDGIAAVARALERVHLGWAMIGWLATLPIVRPMVQLVVDAVGGGPREPRSYADGDATRPQP